MKTEIIVTIIVVLIIIIITVVCIYLIIRTRKREKFLRNLGSLKCRLAPDIEKQQRLSQLEQAMDKLVKEHPVFNKIEDSYSFINMYMSCRNADESEYCRQYLKKRYLSGYRRYDKERLT